MDYEHISIRKISDFFQNLQKFEICQSYILLISQSENILKGIFLLRGSKRMGKSCQHILLCFLVHPNAYCPFLCNFDSFANLPFYNYTVLKWYRYRTYVHVSGYAEPTDTVGRIHIETNKSRPFKYGSSM